MDIELGYDIKDKLPITTASTNSFDKFVDESKVANAHIAVRLTVE